MESSRIMKKTIILIILFFLSCQIYSQIGFNVSNEYNKVNKQIAKQTQWMAKNHLSKNYVILFAPGFLSNSFTETFIEYCMKLDISVFIKEALQKFLPEKIKNLRLGDYYHKQIEFLRNNSIQAHLLEYESEDDPHSNAVEILKQIIAKTKYKKAILVTHSKGGVDTGVALCGWAQLQLNQKGNFSDLSQKQRNFLAIVKKNVSPNGNFLNLNNRVHGWIAQESAFRGSPIADAIVNGNQILSTFAYGLLKFLGGSKKSLQSLVQSVREKWITENAVFLNYVVKNIPTISISAYKNNPLGIYSLQDALIKFKLKEYFDTFLAPTRNFMYKKGICSDGLVPWKNSIIDGSDYVIFNKMDHAAPVMDNFFDNIDRIHFLKVQLQMILNRRNE